MIDSYIKVQLNSLNTIKVLVFSTTSLNNNTRYTLFIDDNPPVELKIKKISSFNYLTMVELSLPHKYMFGHRYLLNVSGYSTQMVEVNNAIYFPEFDHLFAYDGDDLGALYKKKETSFALWAPLAISVMLKIEIKNNEFAYYPMKRSDKGVYRITIKGDLINKSYSYIVNNDGVARETTDPYGFGTTLDSKYSAVVDISYFINLKKIKPKNIINNYSDAIIYETNIRDMSDDISKTTNIINKGKYLGFVETNRKTKANHEAGLDYLASLGITHIQLNPILDFGSVNDLDNKKYNWGYDPISFFALEGSYSLHPEIPMERLKEFRCVVDELHKANLRVVIDVVYNHVYRYLETCLEKILPNYFFMRDGEGNIANASGCGNDIASYRFMARKMILDSCVYLLKAFDVDGFRFDLMGLLDKQTMNNIAHVCESIKPDLILYGEGWNMGNMPFEMKACIENAAKLPKYAFFNDMYRDLVKGSTFDLNKGGYASGDISYTSGMMFALLGCSYDITYIHRFNDINQSLNYIECHDNNTLYDKLSCTNQGEDKALLLRRIMFANAIVMFSLGIPFFHMGQEIGQSKNGNPNTYNIPRINAFDYHLLDLRYDMVNYFRVLCQWRKKLILSKYNNSEMIKKYISLHQFGPLLFYDINDANIDSKYRGISLIFNPSDANYEMVLNGKYDVLFSFGEKKKNIGEFNFPYISLTILGRK